MTESPTPTQTSEKKTCCFGKKIITYACKIWCMIIVCALLAVAAAVLLYFLLTKKPILPERILALPKMSDWRPLCPTELLLLNERFDCYPENSYVDQSACESRGCCYLGTSSNSEADDNLTVADKVPICVYPKNYGYMASGKAESTFSGFELPLWKLPSPSRFGDDLQLVHMKVEMQTKYRLRIKFYDPTNYRYEVPLPQVPVHNSAPISDQEPDVFLYSVTYDTVNKPFIVKVRRSSTDAIIFDTSVGALVFSNQFLELTTRLCSHDVYGLSQQLNLKNDVSFNWKNLDMFSRKLNENAGSHPIYLCVEDDGNAHGIMLLNSNAMEVQVHPSPAVTFRTIGGVLDFYLFLGPTSEDVLLQYTEAIGRPVMPPFWAFGLHIGLSDYTLSDLELFVNEFHSKYIPFESVVLKQETIEKMDFKNENINQFTNLTLKLKSKNLKLILQFKAGLPKSSISDRRSMISGSLQNDLFVTDKWGLNPLEGEYLDEKVVFPDFGSSSVTTWWTQVIKKILSVTEFHGSWLVDNQPISDSDGSSKGCSNDNLNHPPYIPRSVNDVLYDKTLCLDSLLRWKDDTVTYYDSYNFYGHSMVLATSLAFEMNDFSKRKLIVSDSIFIGTGYYAGHCIKEFSATWKNLRSSLSTLLVLQMQGVALSGVNVCGVHDTSKDERSKDLCLRWLQLGIFYPLLQLYGSGAKYIYNAGIDDKEFFRNIRNSLSRRYELLPYLYTLFHLAHTKGTTVLHPLFHEFPFDNETYAIETQFMWGSSLLISPILEKDAVSLNFYLPNGIWYNYYQGGPIISSGEWFTETGGPFKDSKQPAALHIRAGHIITLQKPSETTTKSRLNPMSILVALNSTYQAEGLLFWDDGETKNSYALEEYILVEYSASGNSLIVNGNFGKKVFRSSFYKAAIEQVRIMGLSKFPKRIIIDSSYILSNKQYHWNYDTMVLDLKLILIPLGRRTELKWVF